MKTYIGTVRKIPEEGKTIRIDLIPEISVNGGIINNVHLIQSVLKVTELDSDDCRAFRVEADNSIFYVKLIP